MRSPGESLELRPIRDSDDALIIADIRNEGREFMTHSTSFISPLEQADWYYNVYLPNPQMTAYIGEVGIRAVAYGMIAEKDGDYWLTGIVAAAERGKGFGRALFQLLEENVPADKIMLDVKASNLAARSLYESLGYQYVQTEAYSDILVMQKEVPNA